MATKIKQLKIVGLRGIKETITLNLDGKSVLLYGDNGTGKSSISDSLEWFYTNTVSHLSSEEIDLKEALRNSSLTSVIESSISLSYTNPVINCAKKLYNKKDKLVIEFSNSTEDFTGYVKSSQKENLLLRYQYLRSFIDGTKSDKLKSLSDIIGFSEVTNVKTVLMKSFNATKAEIKNQNFENQINLQKRIIVEKIGAAISQEAQLFEKVNEIIAPFDLGFNITSLKDIDSALLKLKIPINTQATIELKLLEDCHNTLISLKNEVVFIDAEYLK